MLIYIGGASRGQAACEGALQAVKHVDAGMRYQEHKPTAWMPSARDRETWTSNDPRPHYSEPCIYSLFETERAADTLPAPPN